VLFIGVDAKTKTKKMSKPKAPPRADSLQVCPPEGCSPDNHHDPQLNRLKNIESINKPVTDRSLTSMIGLEQKVIDAGYQKGDPRRVLTNMGEGTKARVVGYLLAVKQEPGGESCNCNLREVDVQTDNHLVLVNPKVVVHP
jgi:hypothetical protein